jgi:hypothetical protein
MDILRQVEDVDTSAIVETHIFITQMFSSFDLRTLMLVLILQRNDSTPHFHFHFSTLAKNISNEFLVEALSPGSKHRRILVDQTSTRSSKLSATSILRFVAINQSKSINQSIFAGEQSGRVQLWASWVD